MAIFDGKLKQRLIGALVLIILAVVFLPMILNNKGIKQQDTVVTIPTEPQRPAFPNTPLTQVEVPQVVATNQTDTSAQTSGTNQIATNNQQQTTVNTTNTNNQAPAASTPNANSLTPTWSVQLVAVSNLPNAEAFRDKLRKSNYNAYVRTEGTLHKVFVGPIIDKNEAIRLQQQLQKQFHEKGIVREFQPERK